MQLTFREPSLHKVNWLKQTPITHRALHDESSGIFENTLGAVKQSIAAGYSIEVDLQPSRDFVPMVFHDYKLDRLCDDQRNIRDVDARELSKITISNSVDTIPTLKDLLDLVDGQVGLVLELKGQPGADDGFVAAVSEALDGYAGNVAIMSFNHHLLKDAREIAPHLPLGLTAEGDDKRYDLHKLICEQTNVDFLSYGLENLDCRFVKDFRQTDRPAICWTIKSQADAAKAMTFSDQITFEGFRP